MIFELFFFCIFAFIFFYIEGSKISRLIQDGKLESNEGRNFLTAIFVFQILELCKDKIYNLLVKK